MEALQKDFVAVLPTGAGKTRIASMVLKKMRMLNTNRKRICQPKTELKIVTLLKLRPTYTFTRLGRQLKS